MNRAALAAIVAAAALPMQLHSSDFAAGGAIPTASMATACGGENRSPALLWSNVPKGTRSMALIMHDADAPIAGGFYHWVVYNLPEKATGIAAGAKLSVNQLGSTSLAKPGYYGPCPPPGRAHHYIVTLYALDVAHIAAPVPLSGEALERHIDGHVLARAALEGTASSR